MKYISLTIISQIYCYINILLTTSLVQRDSVQNIVDFKTVLTLDNQNQTVASLQSESYIRAWGHSLENSGPGEI